MSRSMIKIVYSKINGFERSNKSNKLNLKWLLTSSHNFPFKKDSLKVTIPSTV